MSAALNNFNALINKALRNGNTNKGRRALAKACGIAPQAGLTAQTALSFWGISPLDSRDWNPKQCFGFVQ